MTIADLVREHPDLNSLKLSDESCLHAKSWFAILWSCHKVNPIKNSSAYKSSDLDSSVDPASVSNIQFLVIYRFRPDPNRSKHLDDQNEKKYVQLIGMMPYKSINESFWLTPAHLDTDNNLQGEIYDQICEENIIALQDL